MSVQDNGLPINSFFGNIYMELSIKIYFEKIILDETMTQEKIDKFD